MSQQRARKNSGVREAPVRPSLAKASGDTAVPTIPHPKNNERSKNKIPKSIRYDLENALVGLCDVWFEDIKPHLIRNNIKLHVDGMGAVSLAGCNNGVLPTAAPGCSHLDPGAAPDEQRRSTANCASCCSMRRTASRAPCPRQTVGVLNYHPNAALQNKNSKQSPIKLKPNKSQTLVPASPRISNTDRVPRSSRTCTFLPATTTQLRIRIPSAIMNQHPTQHFRTHKIKKYRKVDKNKDTNTNSVHQRPKKLNSILLDEGIEIDQYLEIPKLHLHQRKNHKMKMEQSPNRGLKTDPISVYTQKRKYSDHTIKEKTLRVNSVSFGNIPDSKAKVKSLKPNQRLNMDYAKYGLRKISSIPVGLCLNYYDKSSASKLQATRCAACSIQNSDSKIQSKRHSGVKSQQRRQDVNVQQSKPRVSFNIKRVDGITNDLRTQNAPRLESALHKEFSPDKRLRVVGVQTERCFYDEDKLETERLSVKKKSRNESTTNVQVARLRTHDGTIQPGRYPVSRIPHGFIDNETPPTTPHKRKTEKSKLFSSSLIDIIAKEQEKRDPTALNLATETPNTCRKKGRNAKNKPHWK